MELYKSFEEKSKYFKFGDLKIDNDKDFEEYTKLLAIQYSTGDFIFRGLSEAKYKLYNSSQRYWNGIANETNIDSHEDYDKYIRKLLRRCKMWNSSTVMNLLKTYNISENNSLAYLAFMQHYGAPTPLLDFTLNPHKAIFFAIGELSNYVASDTEIDNYFSVYSTYKNNTSYEVFGDIFKRSVKDEPEGEFDYMKVSNNGIILLDNNATELKIVNNMRIANQEGLFFYNHSPHLPIEEVYKDFADSSLSAIGKEKFDELLMHEHFSSCLNFHKKYASHINKVIKEMQITNEFMYPNINELRDFIIS
jgi:hypothetical protein